MSDRVWLRHPETGGTWHCPARAVPDWLALGWEYGDPPAPAPGPAVAEHLAWRAQQVRPAAPQESSRSRSARRRGNDTQEMSDD